MEEGGELPSRSFERAMRVVAIVFLVKAAALALFVTPLWDVPDETGHYSIVQDLADGRGLPLPGRSAIPANVLSAWFHGKETPAIVFNWEAQHPPLYHLLAVPLLAAARAVTADPAWQFRAPRLLSALCGAAALLLFFRVFREAGADPLLAFAASSAIGFLPMYTHLSSGTNHDVCLALFSGAAALGWIRLVRGGRFEDGLKMGAALALMGAVKFSALPVAAALLLLSWTRLAARGRRRVFEWIAISAVSFSLPAIWTLRHWRLLGDLRVHPLSRNRFDLASFFSYLRNEPVVDHTFKNFLGLIGWTGTGGGEVRWFQISGAFLVPYLLLGLVVAIVVAVRLARNEFSWPGAARWPVLAAAVLVFLFCLTWLFGGGGGAEPLKRLLYSLLAAIPFLAAVAAFRGREPETAVAAGSQLVFLLFAVAFLVNSWEAFEISGQMRATNGRYFFAILPFLAVAFVLPAAGLLRPGRGRSVLILSLLAALVVNETAFYILRVLPFYRV